MPEQNPRFAKFQKFSKSPFSLKKTPRGRTAGRKTGTRPNLLIYFDKSLGDNFFFRSYYLQGVKPRRVICNIKTQWCFILAERQKCAGALSVTLHFVVGFSMSQNARSMLFATQSRSTASTNCSHYPVIGTAGSPASTLA